VLKFFLHVSKKEQKRRFLDRIDRADKNWKFSAADMNERQYWKQYQNAFEETIRKTSSKESPWYVVPADNKWFTRLVVAAAIVEALEKLDLSYPSVSKEQMQSLLEAKAALEKD
jgi:polyphosphate kinase 2 (PPK2 family)